MKTPEQELQEMLQHSFLINWNETKKKWIVECTLLKINIEEDTYRGDR